MKRNEKNVIFVCQKAKMLNFFFDYNARNLPTNL